MARPTIAADSPVQNPAHLGVMLDDIQVEAIISMINEHAAALDNADVPPGTLGVATTTSGAIPLTAAYNYLSITGTQAYTLADGTVAGQTIEIEVSVAASTPLGTITLDMDTAGGGAGATILFFAVGQYLKLIWNGTGWHCTGLRRAGAQTVVVGTTIPSRMAATYNLSVTGTVHGTSTHAIPNGLVPGERFHLDVTTAASTPIGDIAAAYKLAVSTAATSLAHIEATDVVLDCSWDGAAWQTLNFVAGASSATLS